MYPDPRIKSQICVPLQLNKNAGRCKNGAYVIIASYPGRVGGKKRPGIDCLRMRDNSQKNLGIRLCLETVGKINTYTSDIFPYHWKVQPFAG